MKKPSVSSLAVALCLLPSVAIAHTGAAVVSGWSPGFAHPFAGVDHLLAMVAVGLWAAQLGGRATWVVPGAFVGAMTVGGALAVAELTLPWIEQGIAASVLVLGLLIAATSRLPLVATALLVGVFALCHGQAHGAEMPVAITVVPYVIGFAIATALLHGCGIALGMLLRWPRWARLVVGAAVAASGAVLAVT